MIPCQDCLINIFSLKEGENMKEIIPNYYISKQGNVISTRYKKGHGIKELTPRLSNSGYLYVGINGKNYYIHRLLAEAYIPNPENKREVNHKDLNKLNNSLDNLEWVTSSENVRHAKKNCERKSKTSSNSGVLYRNEEKIQCFDSLQQAKIYCKEVYNCCLSTIGCLNVNWKNKLVFIRTIGIDTFNPTNFWKSHEGKIDLDKQKHIKQNKELKGLKGSIYRKDTYVGSAISIREASKKIGANFKKTNDPNIYKVYDYVFIKQ